MKHNDIDNPQITLTSGDLANIFNVYTDDSGMYYYNVSKTVYIPETLDPGYYTTYLTTPKDTWPYIAYKVYGDVKLWWLVCSTNQIQDPTAHPEPNTELKIVKPLIVRSILSKVLES